MSLDAARKSARATSPTKTLCEQPCSVRTRACRVETHLDARISAASKEQFHRELEIAGSARVEDRIESRTVARLDPETAVRHAGGSSECRIVQGSILRAETGVIEYVKHVGL